MLRRLVAILFFFILGKPETESHADRHSSPCGHTQAPSCVGTYTSQHILALVGGTVQFPGYGATISAAGRIMQPAW